jgi:PGF-pre-PGF domain-containing protein
MIPDTTDRSPARTDDDRRRSGRSPGWHTTAAVIAVVFLVFAAPLVPSVVVADHGDDGAPSVPASYYGDIIINGDTTESGTEITAVVNGNSHGSIETAEEGSYGGPGALDEKLVVDGAESGNTVSFEVRGVEAEETVSWESGDVQEVDLTFEDVPESDDSDGSDGENTEEDTGEDNAGGGGGAGGAAPAPPEETEEPTDGTEAPAENAETSTPTDGETTPGPEEETDGVEDVSDAGFVYEAEADISTDSETGTAKATFDSDAPVQEVEFETGSQSDPGSDSESDSGSDIDGSVEVTELSDPPEETGNPPGASATVTDIQVPGDAEDNPATIKLRVSDERLAELDAKAEAMRTYRYSDGEWRPLETRVAEETTDMVVLEADTPGFSFFATTAVGEPDAELSLSSTSVEPGTEVTLDGSGSDDRYGEIVAYNWSVAGEALTGETASLALEEPGEYTVELAVTNDAGETNTTTTTLVVSDPASGDSQSSQDTAAAVDEDGTGVETDSSDAQETFGAVPPVWVLGIGAMVVAIVGGLTVALRRDDSSQERL